MTKKLNIFLAGPRGFCAGVDRAIEMVKGALKKYGAPVYVRHEIVHNKFVVENLKSQGAIFVEELNEIEDKSRPVIFSAHGVPKAVPEEALSLNLIYYDATCPLVSKIHKEVENFDKKNLPVILIGGLTSIPGAIVGGLVIGTILNNFRGGGGSGGPSSGGGGGPGGGFGPMRFMQSTFKEVNTNEVDVTFADVAGCDEAKFELVEVVDFLKDPKKYADAGAKIPKGVLMVGPPGTGRTLLANNRQCHGSSVSAQDENTCIDRVKSCWLILWTARNRSCLEL